MKKLSVLIAILFLALVGCGEDAGGGGGGDDDPGNNDPGNGPANEVDAEIEGGSSQGAVEGESEQSMEGQYHGAVADGELIVSLASTDATIVFFNLDTAFGQIPGSFNAGADLDGAAFLTVTSVAGGVPAILESASGSIRVNQCPNTVGAVVTGSFNNVGLSNTATGAADGALSGDWRVTIVSSDGSADCAPEPANNDPGGDGPSPGNSCPNDTCDGPCCPYLPALQACNLACIANECMDFTDPFSCITCVSACPDESGLTGDQVCVDAFTALNSCAERNGCEGGDLEDDACLADNCCSEYRGAF